VTIPVAAVCSCLVDFAIASVALFGVLGVYGVGVSWKLLLWPWLLLPLVVAATGFGMVLSALNVRYRDIKYTLPFLTQVWLFLTPVIYPASAVPERYQPLVALNPVGGVIDALRSAVLPGAAIRWDNFWISCLATTAVFLLGLWYFHKTEREFADVI
jgi:lipopolysaccharide transport system permease protein